jgi:ethanolamine ammonia-lyase small subunit
MNRLSDYTGARVGLGVAGDSLPTKPLLDCRLAQARARDAVHFPLEAAALSQELAQRNWPAHIVRSAARDRNEYLRRPDKGRRLDDASAAKLSEISGPHPVVFVLADGLSALAVHRHAIPLLEAAFPMLEYAPDNRNPIVIARQARVAIGDHAGLLLRADLAVVVIGERPGLSAPDSLGIYVTWQPSPGRADAERNCISNIQPQGLSYELAAHKLVFLVNEAQRRKLTGIALKEAAGKLLT